MTTIALFGAAGKMGTRIGDKLRDDAEYRMLYVEAGEAGLARLRDQGVTPTSQEDALREADVVILAIPDVLIGPVAEVIVPSLKSGAMVICLDPAAPYAGQLPAREDVTYFVVHPCHPPLISDETDPEARNDFFGGKAKQNVVCALMQGPEEDYARGEYIARRMFAPVMNAHRVTVQQMALLEPAMAETVVLTCLATVKEAMEEAILHGAPPQAARDFLMGHMKVTLGILFGYVDAEISDGAKLAMQRGRQRILQPDWKDVFEPENVMVEIEAITQGA
jgi:hypothetical protein